MRRLTITILAAVLAPSAAASQDSITLAGNLNEVFSDQVPVSGTRLVGLIAGPISGPTNVSRLRFHLPGSDRPQEICFGATTRDGSYSATGSLIAPRSSGGIGRMAYRPRVPELARYPIGDLTALAQLSPCRRDAPLIPLSYGEPLDRLYLMVNGRGATRIAARVRDAAGQSSSAQCAQATGRLTRAFDYLCTLSIRGIRPGRGTVTLTFEERSGESSELQLPFLWAA